MLLTGMITYLLAVVAATVLLLIAVTVRLRMLQRARRQRLARQADPDAIPSRLHQTVDKAELREGRIRSMESRFSVTRRTLYILLVLLGIGAAALPFFRELSPAGISVVVAVISVVIGIAAKPFVENMICGLVLCFGKLTRIGDTVLIDGEYGVIEDVTLTHCIIKRWDWLRYVVPNSSMMTKEFVNYSLFDNYRWVYVEFWVDYGVDMELVEKIAKASPVGSRYFSASEEPRCWIVEMTRDSVKCMVVAWATTPSDGWGLSIDIRKALLAEFRKHGIATHLHRLRHTGGPAEPMVTEGKGERHD